MTKSKQIREDRISLELKILRHANHRQNLIEYRWQVRGLHQAACSRRRIAAWAITAAPGKWVNKLKIMKNTNNNNTNSLGKI